MDFNGLFGNSEVFLDNNSPEQCFTFSIIDDSVFEGNESFTITVVFPPEDNEGLDIDVDPSVITVVIIDDETRKKSRFI